MDLQPTLDSLLQAKLNKLSTDPVQIAQSCKQALEDAQELIGTCLSHTPLLLNALEPASHFTMSPVPLSQIAPITNNPPHIRHHPMDLLTIIAAILHTRMPNPAPSQFQFERTPAATRHNSAILCHVNFDLRQALHNEHHLSPLQFGSKFLSPSTLAPLLAHHPNWYQIHQLLCKGCNFLVNPLSDANHLHQIDLVLNFGNL
jgi:hypothetical protein